MIVLTIVFGALGSFLSGYLISYFKEKGKNQALLGDIKRLTEEKERICIGLQIRH